jgi:hypothetical protein
MMIDSTGFPWSGLLEETLSPRKNLPPLLLELGERPPEPLHYLGVSFGLTANLLRFAAPSSSLVPGLVTSVVFRFAVLQNTGR